jgi:hypothetical protein
MDAIPEVCEAQAGCKVAHRLTRSACAGGSVSVRENGHIV